MMSPDQPTTRQISQARSRAADRKSTRLNSSHGYISYAVFCLKKKNRLTKYWNWPPTSNTSSPFALPSKQSEIRIDFQDQRYLQGDNFRIHCLQLTFSATSPTA